MKVCVKLGETGIETFNKLKQAFGEHALSRSQLFKSYKAFQRAVNPLNMNPALEDLQLQKRITMWRQWEPLCGQTVDSQCE